MADDIANEQPGWPHGPNWPVGHGPPSNSLGADGELYLDVETGDVYGPKLDGEWGPAVSNIKRPPS